MAAQRSSSVTSPATISISSGGKNEGVTNRRSIGPSSPAFGRPSFATTNPTSPISGRRLSSGGGRRYSTAAETESTEFAHYTVQIPATPDHHLSVVAPESASYQERSYISGALFTGGLNSDTRSHIINSSGNIPPAVNHAGILCQMNGCDGEPFVNRSKKPPCECGFLICEDCYLECDSQGGKCPGCKEPYRLTEEEEEEYEAEEGELPLTSIADFGISKRLSMMKSVKGPADFDHNRWLFETKGTYGYGNAVWPTDGNGDLGRGAGGFKGFEGPPNFSARNKRPLTRKVGVSQAIISPYR